jgi:tetratricopeptide (TPR) repeat protein
VSENRIETVHGSVIQGGKISIGTLNVGVGGLPLPPPRQVPPLLNEFVNRDSDIAKLDRLLERAEMANGAVVGVVTGLRGIGKTAIVRRWARVNAERFPDGQLHIDLGELRHRGGVDVSEVVGSFLRALGLREEAIPRELHERVALFASATAGKRLLVVLDNVHHPAEVRPVVPTGAGSAVLATAPTRLEELLRDGARLVQLRPLRRDGALGVLAGAIDGDERLESELEALDALVEICAGLPVALRVCGSMLAFDEGLSVAGLVEYLGEEQGRLQRLSLGEEGSILAVFDAAYRSLEAPVRLAYRRLALHPGPSFDAAVAEAALDAPPEETRGLLEALRRYSLLEAEDERLRFHDLVCVHAREVAERVEPEVEREAAQRRIADFYVQASQRMDRAIIPKRLRIAVEPRPPEADTPSFDSTAAAFAWFERERPNLLAVLRVAAEREWDETAWTLGEALWLPYHNRKHYREAVEVYEIGAEAARRCGNAAAEAKLRNQLSRAHLDLADHDAAERQLDAARELARRAGHRGLQASVTEFTGILDISRGRYSEAIEALEEARVAYEALESQRGVAIQEYHLGRALDLSGRHAEAVTRLRRAAELVDHEADGLTMGRVMIHLGEAQRACGELTDAAATLRIAIDLMRREDAPYYEALARENLARVQRDAGERGEARLSLEAALAIHEGMGSMRAMEVRRELTAVRAAPR